MMVLLKDIVIPAGTVFSTAPIRTVRAEGEFIDCTVGLSRNTAGTFTYEVNHEELAEWFGTEVIPTDG
jgi:hypothetical protein